MAHDEAYYLAEKKIEKERISKSKYLSLKDMKLSEIPELLGNLSICNF